MKKPRGKSPAKSESDQPSPKLQEEAVISEQQDRPMETDADTVRANQASSPMEEEEGPDELSQSDRVRSGVTGHGVRYVLLFGIAGVILAYLILVFFNPD
jgi:hypothetical protein